MVTWDERTEEEQERDLDTIPSLSKPVRAWGYAFIGGKQQLVLGHNYWFRDRFDNSDAVFIRLRATPVLEANATNQRAPEIELWVRKGELPPPF